MKKNDRQDSTLLFEKVFSKHAYIFADFKPVLGILS